MTKTNTFKEHLQGAILGSCDIWDTDYISDNWELDFLTIFVTWQLRVTLDSIRNSCDVYSMIITFHKTRGVHCIIQRDLVKNARRWTVPVYIWCILQQIENDLYKIGRPTPFGLRVSCRRLSNDYVIVWGARLATYDNIIFTWDVLLTAVYIYWIHSTLFYRHIHIHRVPGQDLWTWLSDWALYSFMFPLPDLVNSWKMKIF